jgi:hypothetical protein
MLRYLDKSRKVSTNLENLIAAKSQLKNLVLTIKKISTLKKSWSQVSTLSTVSISISIGLDCQDPQAYKFDIKKLR